MTQIHLGCGEWGFRDLPVAEHFRIARRFGFTVLEFGIGGNKVGRLPENMTGGQIDAYLQLVQESGIATPFCCIENDFTLPSAAEHHAMLERTLASIELAAKLGATHVRLFAGFTPLASMTPAIWGRLQKAFETCDDLCRDLQIEIAIETHGRITPRNGLAFHEHTVTTDRAALTRLLDILPAGIGFNYDPGNIKATDPADRRLCLDLLDARINYCHMKDWRRHANGGWEPVAIGDDDLDYAALLGQMGFDGVYLIEYEPTEDVEEGIERSLAYLKRIGVDYTLQKPAIAVA